MQHRVEKISVDGISYVIDLSQIQFLFLQAVQWGNPHITIQLYDTEPILIYCVKNQVEELENVFNCFHEKWKNWIESQDFPA